MMTQLQVMFHDDDLSICLSPTWANFISREVKFAITHLGIALAEYHAVDLVGTDYIEFETEEDMTLFLLRFG